MQVFHAVGVLHFASSGAGPLHGYNCTKIQTMKYCSALITVLAALVGSASAFSQSSEQMSRRNALLSGAAAAASAALLGPNVASAGETRQGVELTPFNSLAFQYRNSQNGGLDGSTIAEPSIPYSDFLDKLSTGGVEFVEFLAPDGDVAYATLKATEGGAKTR